ncbi:MAG TPA: cytochrome C oxidase subunit IV family protein [Oligoflexia bacterium]|nr:cytochrome C oxidase subunit IV family protein [Oligoflexia bacterium]HMP47246.1 cytochrome C oxidase subunit IV family protein [Oligoflexia bacterium]
MAHHGEWKPLGKGNLPTEDPGIGLGHIVPIPVYNAVFGTLLVLTLVTVWAASLDVGSTTHLIVALSIATVKAAIVTLIFMHLWFEKKLLWVIVIYPLIILALMIVGTTGDASVKDENIPAHAEINYIKGKTFGVNDDFLKPAPKKETTDH